MIRIKGELFIFNTLALTIQITCVKCGCVLQVKLVGATSDKRDLDFVGHKYTCLVVILREILLIPQYLIGHVTTPMVVYQ